MVIEPEKIKNLSNSVVDEIVNGLWMKVECRNRRK
jgi:hypothetical protein